MLVAIDIERERHEIIAKMVKQERKEMVERERKIAAIVFDMTNLDYIKIYTDYASAIGITRDELTRRQKQQAVMDAILKEA